MPTPKGNHDTNISDRDITATSAETLLNMSRAFPDANNNSCPREYNQCVPEPDMSQENLAKTQRTGYTD
jgi:hypothetical protein